MQHFLPDRSDLTPAQMERVKTRARAKFVAALDQAIENVKTISGMVQPEIRVGLSGREIRVDASPTALQANLAIIERALGKQVEKADRPTFTVPIQIVMGGGRTVDVAVAPVAVELP